MVTPPSKIKHMQQSVPGLADPSNLFWWGNLRERGHWGDPGVGGRILGWIFRKWDVGVWTVLGWLRVETGGGHL
jgi:hypothetical protein